MYLGFESENELIRFLSLNRLDGVSKLAFEPDIKWILWYVAVWSIHSEQVQHKVQR